MSGCAPRNDRLKWVRVRESRACSLLDCRNETTDFGHWIPAFSGTTWLNRPYAIALLNRPKSIDKFQGRPIN